MTPELELISLDGLLPAIAAIDRLNSWVRSKSYRTHCTSAREAVYAMKGRAIAAAHEAGLCDHRRVKCYVSCRNCGGTGEFDSWGGECYACEGTGTAVLHFLETRINGWYTWHTPFRNLYSIHRGLWEQFTKARGERVTDWIPNQTGRDLTPVEVAEALNTAETFFPHTRDYALYVGQLPGGCLSCGQDFAEGQEVVAVPIERCALRWDVPYCRPCVEEHTWYALKLKYEPESRPEPLLAHPAIKAWMFRHRVAM